jgi:hypothetical protein
VSRRGPTVAAAAVALSALLAACGGSTAPAPPGSADNPLKAVTEPAAPTGAKGARSNEASSAEAGAAEGTARKGTTPGYQALVERQSRHPRHRFTPCNLVTAAQASAILGGRILAPVEAAQGPTCIYRNRSGSSFVTVAVQSLDFPHLKRQIRRPKPVAVSNRAAVCGTYGQPVLYMPLSRGRVLAVAGPCALARRFAAKAADQLR